MPPTSVTPLPPAKPHVKLVDNYDGSFIYLDGNKPLIELNNYLGSGSSGVCYEALTTLPSCFSPVSSSSTRDEGKTRIIMSKESRRRRGLKEEVVVAIPPPRSALSSDFDDEEPKTDDGEEEEEEEEKRVAIAVKILHPVGYKLAREPLSSFDALREVIVATSPTASSSSEPPPPPHERRRRTSWTNPP